MCSTTSSGNACPLVATDNALVLHVLPLKKYICITVLSCTLRVSSMSWGFTVLGANIALANIK